MVLSINMADKIFNNPLMNDTVKLRAKARQDTSILKKKAKLIPPCLNLNASNCPSEVRKE